MSLLSWLPPAPTSPCATCHMPFYSYKFPQYMEAGMAC